MISSGWVRCCTTRIKPSVPGVIDLRWSERFALSTNSLGTLTDGSGFKPDVSVRTLPAQI